MDENLETEELHYDADEMTAYFTGEMLDDEAEQLESHLGRCAECKQKAEKLSEKSEMWFSWSQEAHREAAASAQKARRRRELRTFLPIPVSAVAMAAAILLAILYVRQGKIITNQAHELVQARKDVEASRDPLRKAELEAQDLRDRLARAIEASNAAEGRTMHLTNLDHGHATVASVLEAKPLLSFEMGSLGPGDRPVETVSVATPVPVVHVQFVLKELRPNAKIDATIIDGTSKLEFADLPLEGTGAERRAVLALPPELVKRLVNHQVQLTLIDREHAPLGSILLTLRLQ